MGDYMELSENEIKNTEMLRRWDNLKDRIPQSFECITIGEIENAYNDYDEIVLDLENDAQHCNHYFYTVSGKPIDNEYFQAICVIDDYVEDDGEWARRFIPQSEKCYNKLIGLKIKWDVEWLEYLEKIYGLDGD